MPWSRENLTFVDEVRPGESCRPRRDKVLACTKRAGLSRLEVFSTRVTNHEVRIQAPHASLGTQTCGSDLHFVTVNRVHSLFRQISRSQLSFIYVCVIHAMYHVGNDRLSSRCLQRPTRFHLPLLQPLKTRTRSNGRPSSSTCTTLNFAKVLISTYLMICRK